MNNVMDQESIVYGCIKDIAGDHDRLERRRVNREAMLSLPSGEDWLFLSQEMFSIPQLEALGGQYHTEVMHFGASYRAVEYEWDQWIASFEALLRKMYWVSATVHLETELSGIHTFNWTSLSDSHIPGATDIKVQCEWTRENVMGF
jgi:hypothetical protein